MTKRQIHMSLDVRGAIRGLAWQRRSSWSLVGSCRKSDGTLMTSDEILDELLDAVAAGYAVIPMCNPVDCPEFDFQNGCPGHEIPESDTPTEGKTVPNEAVSK